MFGLLLRLMPWVTRATALFGGWKMGESLFGSGGSDLAIPAGGDTSALFGGHPPEEWSSMAADGEKNAADTLAKKTAVLKTLDEKLAGLASQISDDNDAAKKKLLSVKGEIDRELAYLDSSGDSSVVKSEAVNKFLQDKAGEIAQVISDAAGKVPGHREALNNVGSQYGGSGSGEQGGGGEVGGGGAGGGGGAYAPWDDGYGSGYGPGYDDGYGADPGAGGLADGAASMLPGLASMLPGALGGPLSGLGAPLSSLGDLASAARQDPAASDAKLVDHVEKDNDGAEKNELGEHKGTQAGEKDNNGSGDEGGEQKQGAQPIANEQTQTPPPAPASTLVTRPDGSTTTAGSEQLAAAARAHLGGQDLERAYRDAELFLPPAGTPVKDSLPSASAAQMGDLAVFKDRYVMMGGDNTVYLDGEMQPMSALSKLSGFLGFRRAPQPAGGSTPAVQVSAPTAAESVAMPTVS